jgi:hypothetical protein
MAGLRVSGKLRVWKYVLKVFLTLRGPANRRVDLLSPLIAS